MIFISSLLTANAGDVYVGGGCTRSSKELCVFVCVCVSECLGLRRTGIGVCSIGGVMNWRKLETGRETDAHT